MKGMGDSLTIAGGLMESPRYVMIGRGSQLITAPQIPGQMTPTAVMGGGGGDGDRARTLRAWHASGGGPGFNPIRRFGLPVGPGR